MSQLSQWPLTPDAIRFTTPEFMLRFLADNRLTRACYPSAARYYPTAANHSMTREKHDDNLLIYCAEGSGSVTTGHYEGLVKQGDLILLPEGRSHHYHSSEQSPWTIYWIHFSGLEAAALIKSLDYDPERPVVHLGQQPILIGDFKRLMGLRQSGFQHGVFTYAASLVRQILCHLALVVRSTTAITRHNFNLEEIQGLMIEHLDGALDLNTLAACANLSRYHFANKYKQLTGYPPIKHFLHMKMERACYLLDSSELPVKAIGFQLGYRDPLYFSRMFRKVMGTAPTTYRQLQRV